MAVAPLPILGKDNEQEVALPLLSDGFFACDTSLSFCLCGIALKDLKVYIGSVQEVLSDPKLAGPQRRLERRHRAVTVLHRVFDFREMSRRSLGANARSFRFRKLPSLGFASAHYVVAADPQRQRGVGLTERD
jgi:hypothetical protein